MPKFVIEREIPGAGKLTAAELQDQEITFVHGPESNESFTTGDIYSSDSQLLNRLFERKFIRGNRYLNRLIRFHWISCRMFDNKRKPLEFTTNRESKGIRGTPVGQQLAVLQ